MNTKWLRGIDAVKAHRAYGAALYVLNSDCKWVACSSLAGVAIAKLGVKIEDAIAAAVRA